MASTSLNIYLPYILVILFYFLTLVVADPPKILAENEFIVEAGQNYTVLCEGNTPLNWTTPEMNINYGNDSREYAQWTKVRIRDVLPENQSHTHASRIFIENVTFPFTGYYYCYNVEDNTEFDKHYLFVSDPEHLAVPNQDPLTLTVVQYETTTIPCRPTSPDVEVVLQAITPTDVNNTSYDPKTGLNFTAYSLNDQGVYYCVFTRGTQEFEQLVLINVVPSIRGLPKPKLEDLNDGHTIMDEELRLKCTIHTAVAVNIDWMTPSGPASQNKKANETLMRSMGDTKFEELLIRDVTASDRGRYFCIVNDLQGHSTNASITVKIFEKFEHFINLTEDNGYYKISAQAGDPEATWSISMHSHPPITSVDWLNNRNEKIANGLTAKYYTSHTDKMAVLTIKQITLADFGNYTLVAHNRLGRQSLDLFLNVTDKPSVELNLEPCYFINKPAYLSCTARGHPLPKVEMRFKTCSNGNCTFESIKSRQTTGNLAVTAHAVINADKSGIVECNASNTLGSESNSSNFYLSDVVNGLDIFGFAETVDFNRNTEKAIVAVGEMITLTCGASVLLYNETVSLRHNNNLFQDNDERISIERSRTPYSTRVSVTIRNVGFLDGGRYSCNSFTKLGEQVFKNITLLVKEGVPPVINTTNMKSDIKMELPNSKELYCTVSGIPKPTIAWFKDDSELIEKPNHIEFKDAKQRLFLNRTDPNDEGLYRCEVSNKMGSVSRQVSLQFTNKPEQFTPWLIAIIIVLSIGILSAIIMIICKVKKERKLEKELKLIGLANFEKGGLENLNPDLCVDEQAELLPYDKKWEFPIEKLKLGKQLGSGAFGVVMKGEAKGLIEGEPATTVAVKMVKKNADHTYIKALASELKIMVHLGKHLNVVNLMGACTKNVAKKELLVIVEYCRFGNLQNYLLRHRENFIDQVDHKTRKINYNIGQEILERHYSVSSNRSNNPQTPYLKYAALAFNSNGEAIPKDMEDYRGDNYFGTTAKTDVTTVSMSPTSDDEGVVVSNNSVQPEWRSNYRGDYRGDVRPICTKDLLVWAFQVARGMEYLASRKVLHGDLAARNILLAENNVVKICDFGLAKSMYKSDNYRKKSDGPLPVKWMAVESIRDRIFSTQSDVWSFGIVLWEFFSLGRTPYPGMEADERLYNKLVDGYRMESPDYAPQNIYKMMLDCWHSKPGTRPTFGRLSERLGSMLEDSVKKHYIDLNDPYLVMNTQRKEDGHSDYLAMFTPPNFENLSSPHQYQNESDVPGYLCMKSANIFSPRPDGDGEIFDFSAVKTKKDKNSLDCTGNELLPMLSSPSSESDCDSSACNSPNLSNSVSNPTYHLPPLIEDKIVNSTVKSTNNYNNLPQNNGRVQPFIIYDKDKDSDNVHYVNSNTIDWESVNV